MIYKTIYTAVLESYTTLGTTVSYCFEQVFGLKFGTIISRKA